ncbi:MAG TPA: DUF1488 family protein [Acetobacteraceae bacterium]|nr:DUF1488 family protein [Acetobacteraceae bacterium]
MHAKAAPGRWDDHQVLFEIEEGQREIACSVSVEALEEAGPGHGARRWQLLEAFDRLRPRIERIARDRHRTAPGGPVGTIHVNAGDLNDPAPSAPAVALRRSAAG